MNRSKAKGTWAESRVVEWLRMQCSFHDARRNTLGGRFDPGDIDPIPMDPVPIVISVKNGYGGIACSTCHHIRDVHPDTAQFKEWWDALLRTGANRNQSALLLLTVKREGKTNPEYWHWYVHSMHLVGIGQSGSSLGVIKITGQQARTLMYQYIGRYGVAWENNPSYVRLGKTPPQPTGRVGPFGVRMP